MNDALFELSGDLPPQEPPCTDGAGSNLEEGSPPPPENHPELPLEEG